MLYLYWAELLERSQKYKAVVWTVIAVLISAYYWQYGNMLVILLLFSAIVVFAMVRMRRRGVLKNRFTGMVSQLSMEIYLSQMVAFRVLEKLNLLHLFELDVLSFLLVSLLTFIGSAVGSFVLQ